VLRSAAPTARRWPHRRGQWVSAADGGDGVRQNIEAVRASAGRPGGEEVGVGVGGWVGVCGVGGGGVGGGLAAAPPAGCAGVRAGNNALFKYCLHSSNTVRTYICLHAEPAAASDAAAGTPGGGRVAVSRRIELFQLTQPESAISKSVTHSCSAPGQTKYKNLHQSEDEGPRPARHLHASDAGRTVLQLCGLPPPRGQPRRPARCLWARRRPHSGAVRRRQGCHAGLHL
jgi:hypothetical protein